MEWDGVERRSCGAHCQAHEPTQIKIGKLETVIEQLEKENARFCALIKSLSREHANMIPKWLFILTMGVMLGLLGFMYRQQTEISKQIASHVAWGAESGKNFEKRVERLERGLYYREQYDKRSGP